MKTLNEYKLLIEQWSIDRNLHTANPKAQFLKVVEEAGEIYEAIEFQEDNALMDAIGDTYVTIVILAQQLNLELKKVHVPSISLNDNNLFIELSKTASGLSKDRDVSKHINRVYSIVLELSLEYKMNFLDCVSVAYNEIKDRKGKMIDGTFVKADDL